MHSCLLLWLIYSHIFHQQSPHPLFTAPFQQTKSTFTTTLESRFFCCCQNPGLFQHLNISWFEALQRPTHQAKSSMNMLRFSIGTGSFGSKEIWRMSVKKEIPACFFSGISVFGMGCSMEVYNSQGFKCSNNLYIIQLELLHSDHTSSRGMSSYGSLLKLHYVTWPCGNPLIPLLWQKTIGKTHSPHALRYYHARHQKGQVQIIQLMGKRTWQIQDTVHQKMNQSSNDRCYVDQIGTLTSWSCLKAQAL